MSENLNIFDKLDFSEMDLTPPDKIIAEILAQLPKNTQNIVSAGIVDYEGYVTSHKKPDTTERFVEIQDSLGKIGEKEHKFECFLYTASYKTYKYRMFFIRYGIVPYPVQFTLERSIYNSIDIPIKDGDFVYDRIITCNKRAEVEDLLIKILTSKKVLGVMQELIRVYQANKNAEPAAAVTDPPVTAK